MAERRRLKPGAVADAGPVIHLLEVGAPQALALFHQVLLPEPVASELRARPDGPAARFLTRAPLRVIRPTPAENEAAEAYSLRYEIGLVDGAVLAAAKGRAFPLVATDDLQLRDACKVMGLQPVGTLGILLRATAGGQLRPRETEAALDAVLTHSSLFVTRGLVDEARAALRKMSR